VVGGRREKESEIDNKETEPVRAARGFGTWRELEIANSGVHHPRRGVSQEASACPPLARKLCDTIVHDMQEDKGLGPNNSPCA
jgi:hypothetical protein